MRFITLPDHDELPIHCPFCGKRVIDLDSDPAFGPCEHVLRHFMWRASNTKPNVHRVLK